MVRLIEEYIKHSIYARTVKDRNNLRKLLMGEGNSFLSNWKPGSDYYSEAIEDTVINALNQIERDYGAAFHVDGWGENCKTIQEEIILLRNNLVQNN